MPIARVVAAGQADRLKSLADGVFSFGADFNCDVVLIDEGILPVHFRIEVSSDQVRVTLEPGAQGALQDRTGAVTELVPGGSTIWLSTQHLVTEGIEVHLGGAPVVLPERQTPRLVAMARKLAVVLRVHVFGLSIMAGILLVANTDFASSLSRPASGSEVTRMTFAFPTGPFVLRMPGEAALVPGAPEETRMTLGELEARLIEAGFVPDALLADPRGFTGVFYLDRVGQRDALRAMIAEEGLPLRAETHLHSQLMSAINITLESAAGDARLVSLEKGDVVLDGLRREVGRRPSVIAMIKSDVPGVKTVRFEHVVGADAEEAVREIAAVWIGPRPYVVLVDGRVIRPGQEIVNDIALRDVLSADRITVERDGTSEEVMIQ